MLDDEDWDIPYTTPRQDIEAALFYRGVVQRMEQLEALLHDYYVFCNTPFVHVVNASGEDFLGTWKQDRDALQKRARDLLEGKSE